MIDSGSTESDVAVPEFPHSVLTVNCWPDPVLDRLGHDPRSPYAEQFWLSVLGPSCLFLVRRLVTHLDRRPDGFEFSTVEWAGELGLGMKGGRHSPFWRSIERACRFRVAQRNGSRLVVHRRLPPLTQRQVERLPSHLARAHQAWLEQQLARPVRPTLAKWSASRSVAAGSSQETRPDLAA